MSSTTPNLGLIKGDAQSPELRKHSDANMDAIDAAVGALQQGGGGGGGSTPGSPTGSVQGNHSGAFAGIPGSEVDFVNGLLSLAPTGRGPALVLHGDAGNDNILELWTTGADAAAMEFYPNGDGGVGMYTQNTDGSGNIDLSSSEAKFTYGAVAVLQVGLTSGMTGDPSIGFFAAPKTPQQTITGAKADPVAASILAALVAYGLVIDGTT